jgi:hypothetical protein
MVVGFAVCGLEAERRERAGLEQRVDHGGGVLGWTRRRRHWRIGVRTFVGLLEFVGELPPELVEAIEVSWAHAHVAAAELLCVTDQAAFDQFREVDEVLCPGVAEGAVGLGRGLRVDRLQSLFPLLVAAVLFDRADADPNLSATAW